MSATFDSCYIRKDKRQVRLSNDFTQMVWKGAKKVAFGVKSPWVVAWYCPKGNTPAPGMTGSNAAYELNVKNTCVIGGMNVCYNRLALKAHNLKRLNHKDTPPMGAYDAAAKAI